MVIFCLLRVRELTFRVRVRDFFKLLSRDSVLLLKFDLDCCLLLELNLDTLLSLEHVLLLTFDLDCPCLTFDLDLTLVLTFDLEYFLA